MHHFFEVLTINCHAYAHYYPTLRYPFESLEAPIPLLEKITPPLTQAVKVTLVQICLTIPIEEGPQSWLRFSNHQWSPDPTFAEDTTVPIISSTLHLPLCKFS
jgi:hypothetical protein